MWDYVFLDLDGPLLEGKHRHYQCYCDILAKYSGVPLALDAYWELKRSMVKRDVILKQSQFAGSYDDFFAEWMKNIEAENYLALDVLKPGVHEALAKLKNLTRHLFLVTMRHNRAHLLVQLSEFDILKYFDRVVDCPPGIENPKFAALRDIAFGTAIFIGDTEEDTITAKKLGIQSVGITNGLRRPDLLHSDIQVTELRDIDFNALLPIAAQ